MFRRSERTRRCPLRQWILVGQNGLLTLCCDAHTKSEARAKFKEFVGGNWTKTKPWRVELDCE